jgi:putative peptidoglycan lipid II flippase
MATTMVSRLLGFLRVAVIGAVFGASGRADVLNLVFSIPNNLRKLMAEGALSSAFIPVLSRSLVEDGTGEKGQRVVREILTVQFVVLVPVLILSTFFAQPIVNTILDFPEPERQQLAAELFRWMIHYILLISVSAVLMATLNSHRRFFVPAFTPLLFSVAVISSILLFSDELGVYSMAVGVLVGGMLQLLFQVPLFAKLGYSFLPRLRNWSPEIRQILRQWLPVVGTASIFAVNQQIAMLFASGLEDGSGSAVTNALTFWQLPFGIFGVSIQTVLFPRMSRQAAQYDEAGLAETLQYGVRYLFALLVPAAVVLSLLGPEVIAVALQRGAFEARHTLLAADVLVGYCFGLWSVATFNFVQRFYYARGNFRFPMVVAVITLVLNVGLALWLKETHLRVVGLAVSNSIAFSVGLLIMLARAGWELGGFRAAPLLRTLWKVSLTCAVLAVLCMLFRARAADFWLYGSSLPAFLLVAGALLGCCAVVAGMYYLLKVEAFQELLRRGKS